MARSLTAARSALRRFHTVSAFNPPPPAVGPPPAEPMTNLFVSGKRPHPLQHLPPPTHREGRSPTPPSGLRRFSTISAFSPPPPAVAPPPSEPSTNLFVSARIRSCKPIYRWFMERAGWFLISCLEKKHQHCTGFHSPEFTRFGLGASHFVREHAIVGNGPCQICAEIAWLEYQHAGLSKRTTSDGLRDAFAAHGELLHARVVTDRVSGYSKGFGFVRYATLEDAANGIKGMDGKFLDGWVIFAEYARPRATQAPPTSEAVSNY